MSWIPKKNTTGAGPAVAVAAPVKPAHRPSHAHSLEMPVVLSVRRLPAPVYGTLMEITAHGAKIRSLVLMERGTEVEFDLGIGSGAPLTINGRVEARRNAPSGARFEYHLVFSNMPESEIDALARHVRELERRAAAARSIQKSIDSMPTTDRERRGSYRALT
ncbi:MAG: PilZ domain-containing protein, partial [Candidatus Eremiobacteraeota bacterium]|nr:PilZ domain-containing protein [Candidatus Eremiobacteraeota bacterium]